MSASAREARSAVRTIRKMNRKPWKGKPASRREVFRSIFRGLEPRTKNGVRFNILRVPRGTFYISTIGDAFFAGIMLALFGAIMRDLILRGLTALPSFVDYSEQFMSPLRYALYIALIMYSYNLYTFNKRLHLTLMGDIIEKNLEMLWLEMNNLKFHHNDLNAIQAEIARQEALNAHANRFQWRHQHFETPRGALAEIISKIVLRSIEFVDKLRYGKKPVS